MCKMDARQCEKRDAQRMCVSVALKGSLGRSSTSSQNAKKKKTDARKARGFF